MTCLFWLCILLHMWILHSIQVSILRKNFLEMYILTSDSLYFIFLAEIIIYLVFANAKEILVRIPYLEVRASFWLFFRPLISQKKVLKKSFAKKGRFFARIFLTLESIHIIIFNIFKEMSFWTKGPQSHHP